MSHSRRQIMINAQGDKIEIDAYKTELFIKRGWYTASMLTETIDDLPDITDELGPADKITTTLENKEDTL